MSDLGKAMHFLSEKELQEACIEMMEWHGWMCYHTYDSRRSHPGFPDLVAVKGTRVMFVEFKSKTGKVKEAQAAWLTGLSVACREVYLVRPQTYDAFYDVIVGVVNLTCHWNNQPERTSDDE